MNMKNVGPRKKKIAVLRFYIMAFPTRATMHKEILDTFSDEADYHSLTLGPKMKCRIAVMISIYLQEAQENPLEGDE